MARKNGDCSDGLAAGVTAPLKATLPLTLNKGVGSGT